MYLSALLLPLLTSQALAGCIYARSAEEFDPQDAFHASIDHEGIARRASKPIKREPIGDLKDGITTQVGRDIAEIILDPEDVERLDRRQSKGSGLDRRQVNGLPAACNIWQNVTTVLRGLYDGCNDNARGAIRLGFHDAASWEKTQGTTGGADGSIILFKEYFRPENKGLYNISLLVNKIYTQYHPYGVGMADLIQWSGILAARICPLGPGPRAFVGRPDALQHSPEHLIPNATGPTSTAPYLIDLFANKTLSSTDLVALIGAHSTAKQFFLDPALAGESQDSTPTIWDTSYYTEQLQPQASPGVFRFDSDVNLANYNVTNGDWNTFAGDRRTWNTAYESAYLRMSMFGVPNVNNLTECTELMPVQD